MSSESSVKLIEDWRESSMMHTMTPDKDRQRKRSETPRGFARAVFEANYQAMLAMAS